MELCATVFRSASSALKRKQKTVLSYKASFHLVKNTSAAIEMKSLFIVVISKKRFHIIFWNRFEKSYKKRHIEKYSRNIQQHYDFKPEISFLQKDWSKVQIKSFKLKMKSYSNKEHLFSEKYQRDLLTCTIYSYLVIFNINLIFTTYLVIRIS